MNFYELEQRVVFQEQRALDLTMASPFRVRAEEIRSARDEARTLAQSLRSYGDATNQLLSRLDAVMVDLICVDERIRSFYQRAAA